MPTIEELIADLNSPSIEVRQKAILMLHSRGLEASAAIHLLIKALDDDSRVSFIAKMTLRDLEKVAIEPLVEVLLKESTNRTLRSKIGSILSQMGEPAVDPLTKVISYPDSELREIAVNILGQLGNMASPAASQLVKALSDSDHRVSLAASLALERVGKAASEALIQAFLNPEIETKIRFQITGMLSRLGDKEVIAPLTRALSYQNSEIRWMAAYGLSHFGSDASPAVDALIQALSDKEERVRENAIEALGNIGPAASKAVNFLIKFLYDATSYIRFHAAVALGKFGKDAEPAIAPLTQLLSDEKEDVRLGAASGLIHLDPSNSAALDVIIEALSDEDNKIRWFAANLLEDTGPKDNRLLDALSNALHDPDNNVRDAAYNALINSKKDTFKTLIQGLTSNQTKLRIYAARAIRNMGPKAYPATEALIKALDDPDSYVRAYAATALGQIGAKEALPKLRRMVENDTGNMVTGDTVKDMALDAIKSIEYQLKGF